MIDDRQSPFGPLRADGPGIGPFLRRRAERVRFYGSGKVALRDGLAPVAKPGGNVLLPAYVPDAVGEPIRELGLDVRYYGIEASLAPDVTDLEERADGDTVAVVTVAYFGVPRADLEAVRAVTERYDCLHVDDAAHAALSEADEGLVGTRGDMGFASLRKLFPIPDGACLYLSGDLSEEFEPSDDAGVRGRFGAEDATYLLRSAAAALLGGSETLRSVAEAAVAGEDDGDAPPPGARYEAARSPMSRVSAALMDRVDPESVRAVRRENYHAWERGLAGRGDVRPAVQRLDSGVCPQVYPVVADDADRFLAELADAGVRGAHTWPRLPAAVRAADEYETARRLANRLVALPVHQQLDPAEIATACRRLRS